jgi:hypothetical protein
MDDCLLKKGLKGGQIAMAQMHILSLYRRKIMVYALAEDVRCSGTHLVIVFGLTFAEKLGCVFFSTQWLHMRVKLQV